MRTLRNGPPSPDEFQRQLAEFMRKHFPGVTNPAFATEEGGEVGRGVQRTEDDFQFAYKPRDVKAHLDRFVIKQEEAKKVLAIAVCDHYNHAKYLHQLEKEDSARVQTLPFPPSA